MTEFWPIANTIASCVNIASKKLRKTMPTGVTISKNALGLGITLSAAGLGTSAVASLLAVTAWDQSRAEESVMTRPLHKVTPT
ncbi:hypothetical protein FTV88_1308 [Heliorestis convoluta]|uniref:Uncharacterized protein n=1 Tax=Heliorestis convoluta TaxID=356322 RepID=A0A5Q2N4F3_9FIRM|nr:hypothetical protein FTV88_1308 [Heliorestis convoluta]